MSNETISDDMNKLHEELLETPDNHSVILSAGFVRKLIDHYQATKELQVVIDKAVDLCNQSLAEGRAINDNYDDFLEIWEALQPLPTKGDE